MPKKLSSLLAAWLCPWLIAAQLPTAADSLPPQLLLEQVYEQVLLHHPLIRQAELLGDIAEAEIRLARGGFDPGLDVHWNQKILKGTQYYTNWNNFVKIPTWWGPEIKAGYERYVGINVNPENFTPKEGLIYAEINVPLGRDLLFDMRRNVLQQARLLPQMNEAERLKTVNKLLLQVAKDYWDWYYTYRALAVYELGYQLAAQRFAFTQQAARIGEAAAIDTVEARLEMLDREILQAEAQIKYRNAALALSNHLWTDSGLPLELQPGITPLRTDLQARIPEGLDSLQQTALSAHPELLKLNVKMQQLAFERRFQSQARLPQLSVDLKPYLIPGTDPFAQPGIRYWEDNFKVGVNFYTPLFLRKERAKLQLTDIKLQSTQWEIDATRREIQVNVQSSWNDLNNYVRLVGVQIRAVSYSGTLLDASQVKFRAGETSLFLVNSYERKLLKEQVGLAELQAKYAKSLAAYYFSSGTPLRQLQY
ncbi:MAG: TolC family protein [Sphingobacteriia bacterium]